MRYFLVDLQTTRHRESMLKNKDENLYLGGTLLIPKLKNVLMTHFFKIVGRDEVLKYKYRFFLNYKLNAQFLYSSTICMLH